MATVREKHGSRQGSGSGLTRVYEVFGAGDELEAQNTVVSFAPAQIGDGFKIADVSYTEVGSLDDGDYLVTVTWSRDSGLSNFNNDPNEEPPFSEYRFNFIARGAHVFYALEAPSVYVRSQDEGLEQAYTFGRAIGVAFDGGEKRVEGARIDPPAETYTIVFDAPPQAITNEYRNTVENICGKVNETDYAGADAGSLMLVRVSGGIDNRTGRWRIEFGFGYVAGESEPFDVGDVEVPSKRGLDYLWAFTAPNEDGELDVLAAHVCEVWKRAEFSDLKLPIEPRKEDDE